MINKVNVKEKVYK